MNGSIRFIIPWLILAYSHVFALERPETWARPVEIDGVPNLHRIDQRVMRSAQPSALGLQRLSELGVRTVVNLRANHDDQMLLNSPELELVRIPINTWNINDRQVAAAMRAIRSATRNGPVLIHCQHGADRTGLISAVYRILDQGWSKEQALEELTKGGYGFHPIWKNIPRYIQDLDIEKLKKQIDQPI